MTVDPANAQELANIAREIGADVLKVAHHGSKYSSSQAFLIAVTPIYAVICVGEDNPYGHPAPETLARLAVVSADVYRTDLHGTVVITSDGQSLWTRIRVVRQSWMPMCSCRLYSAARTPNRDVWR